MKGSMPSGWTYPGKDAAIISDFFRLVVRAPGPHRGLFFICGKHAENFTTWAPGDVIDFVVQGIPTVVETATLVRYDPAPHLEGHGHFVLT
jgi:hypothetical protein